MSPVRETMRSCARRRRVRAPLVIATMAVVFGSLASSDGAAAPPGSIPSPVSGGWQLNGSAKLITTGSPANLQLTAATNYQAGSAFWPTPVPGVGIAAAFDAFIGPGSGADGLTFTLADASVTKPTALGINGGGEGFSGIKGIAVSLDTWKNAVNPSSNFVGIATDVSTAGTNTLNYVTTNSSIPSLRNAVHHFVVTTFSTGMTVTMDGAQVLSYTISLPPTVLLGFTGGTGGFNDVHQVQNVFITTGPPPPAPTVTGVSPPSGPTSGGTTVTITGTGLTGASAVKFGGTAATTYSVGSDGSISATSPPGTLGSVDVTVTTPGGPSATGPPDLFTYVAGPPPPAPTVTGVSPPSGPTSGGTTVTIAGTGLTAASGVKFGGTAAATYSVGSDSSISATSPIDTPGPVDVTVTTTFGGTSATNPADLFTYVAPPAPTVTGVSPSSGPTTGGTTVTIAGTGLTGASAVKFGGTAATTYSVGSDSSISATSPPGTLGPIDVTVTTPGGQSATGPADLFSYVTGPPPGSIPSPVSGGWQLNGSAQLMTTGSPPNLQLTAATNWQAGSAFWPTPVPGVGISAAFDAFIGSGSGADGLTFTLADASVTRPTALGVNGGGEGFSGIKGIAVSLDTWKNTVNPSSNFVGIATDVSTVGTNTLNYVTTNSSIASLRSAVHHFVVTTSSTGITVTMDGAQVLSYATSLPPSVLLGFTGATGGFNDIHQVQNVSITAIAPPAPTVTGVSPTSGFNGTSVTVTGTNFTNASAVDFGAAAATFFTVNNSNSITATAPFGTLGTVDVTVTTPGGTSATGAADQFTYIAGPPTPTLVATYRGDLGRSGYYPSQTGVTTANAASLKLHWTDTGGTGSFAQPIVANNMVYWGDWNGLEHGTDLTGKDVWAVNVGVDSDSACSPPVSGPSGTVTAALMGSTPVVYVPGGDDNFYALNALTGALIWKTNLGTLPADFLWSSPILYNGSIYEGIASFGDCPLVQGQLVQMNASTGAIQHIANMTPNGCIGAGIWTSPTIDPSDGSIYVTTATPNACSSPGELAPAIVKLRASDLSVLSSWTVPVAEQAFGDEDFGATPTLFTATINGVHRSLVGALNKDGLFFAWDRTNLAAGPVWQSTIADPSGSPRSIVSASWDGSLLYVGGGGATINGTSCYGNISALDPATGAFVWRSCQTSFMTAGLTEVPGMLIEGVGAGGDVVFLNTANGATVSTFATKSMVQGEVTVSNGIVYVPLANGNLVALGQ